MPTNIYLWSNFKLIIGRLFGLERGGEFRKQKMIAHSVLCYKTNGSYICCIRMKLLQRGEVDYIDSCLPTDALN